jgi:hypothetical protein
MVSKNLTKEQQVRFDKLNLIHPKKMKPNEKYEFNLLLGKKYLYLSTDINHYVIYISRVYI